MNQRLPLAGLRILSLGLNLPAPVAAQRARQLGARVCKIEPPHGDPVAQMAPAVYTELHQGLRVLRADLHDAAGQALLARELARADVLLTSFRPQALRRLGLAPAKLRRDYPGLWQVSVVGQLNAPDEAGHDLCYQAALGLLPAQGLPASLWADLCGAQAALQALHAVQIGRLRGQRPRSMRVGLQDALAEAAAPWRWGLTPPGALLAGAHAGYQRYGCADGELVVAALEPRFAARLARLAGLPAEVDWLAPSTQAQLAAWLRPRRCSELHALAPAHDLPLVVCPKP